MKIRYVSNEGESFNGPMVIADYSSVGDFLESVNLQCSDVGQRIEVSVNQRVVNPDDLHTHQLVGGDVVTVTPKHVKGASLPS